MRSLGSMSHPLLKVTHMNDRSHLRAVPDLLETVEPILSIDCDECAVQHTNACADCLVSYIVGREIGQPVEFAKGEARAVQLLAEAGLVPGSRFQREQPVA